MQKLATAVHAEGLRKMGVRDRQAMEEKLKVLKDQMARPVEDRNDTKDRARPDLIQEPDKVRREIKKIEELLNKDDDLVAHGGDKDALVAKLKTLCGIIKKEALTEREEACRPTKMQDYNKAVEKQVAHQRAHLKHIQEAQELGKRLEPLDPEAGNIKALLKKYG